MFKETSVRIQAERVVNPIRGWERGSWGSWRGRGRFWSRRFGSAVKQIRRGKGNRGNMNKTTRNPRASRMS